MYSYLFLSNILILIFIILLKITFFKYLKNDLIHIFKKLY